MPENQVFGQAGGGIKMNISNKMKEIRAITGLTRKDFSDKYGIPLRTLEE